MNYANSTDEIEARLNLLIDQVAGMEKSLQKSHKSVEAKLTHLTDDLVIIQSELSNSGVKCDKNFEAAGKLIHTSSETMKTNGHLWTTHIDVLKADVSKLTDAFRRSSVDLHALQVQLPSIKLSLSQLSDQSNISTPNLSRLPIIREIIEEQRDLRETIQNLMASRVSTPSRWNPTLASEIGSFSTPTRAPRGVAWTPDLFALIQQHRQTRSVSSTSQDGSPESIGLRDLSTDFRTHDHLTSLSTSQSDHSDLFQERGSSNLSITDTPSTPQPTPQSSFREDYFVTPPTYLDNGVGYSTPRPIQTFSDDGFHQTAQTGDFAVLEEQNPWHEPETCHEGHSLLGSPLLIDLDDKCDVCQRAALLPLSRDPPRGQDFLVSVEADSTSLSLPVLWSSIPQILDQLLRNSLFRSLTPTMTLITTLAQDGLILVGVNPPSLLALVLNAVLTSFVIWCITPEIRHGHNANWCDNHHPSDDSIFEEGRSVLLLDGFD